jgi:hypothetical protein
VHVAVGEQLLEVLVAPGSHGVDDGDEAAAKVCELVLDVGRIGVVVVSDGQSVTLHVAQGLGEDFRSHGRKG